MLSMVAIAAVLAHTVASQPIDLRIMRHPQTKAHYLRLTYDVAIAGIQATEVGIYDIDDGRYVEHLAAGPVSSSGGFDGTHVWGADVTGFPQIEDHRNSVIDDLAAAHFQGRRGPEVPSVTVRTRTPDSTTVVLRYAGLAGPIGVTFSHGRVVAVDDYAQVDATHARYSDYRVVQGIELPFRDELHSPERTSSEHVRSVEVLATVPARTFAVPRVPDDYTIHGARTTSVSLGDLKGNEPIVDVRIDDGPALHMLFDSGSSNTMSTRTARRLGLRSVGSDRTGGIGTGMVPEHFAIVRRMRIGAAELRDTPFAIFDDASSTTDGTIGCEVLERFTTRFDFLRHRLTLALSPQSFTQRHAAIPMHLEGCQPEVDASFDRYAGAFGIDTGSGSDVDVMAPFVRAHGLIAHYRARVRYDGAGIGGAVYAGQATAKAMEFGGFRIDDVPIELSTMHGGAFDDASQVGNIGVGLLRDFVVTFDYRSRRMWLDI